MAIHMTRVLSVTLLLLTPLLAAPQFEDDHHLPEDNEEADAPVAWSEEETTTKRLNLEDPASWSASTEVLDENHAWYRRRRSVEGPSVDAAEEEPADDLVAAESVVFTPSHLRKRKKVAHEECRRRRREFAAWRRLANHHGPTGEHCNGYCCYPVAVYM